MSKNYSDLKKVGLDCVLTWQETYDEDLYNYHIPSGPKAWGVDENLKLQKNNIFTVEVEGGLRIAICSVPKRKLVGLAKRIKDLM